MPCRAELESAKLMDLNLDVLFIHVVDVCVVFL
jgi:hypothetical protein